MDVLDDDWRHRGVLSISETAEVLDLSKNATYAAVERGEIPSLRVGRRLLVPVGRLRRMLGETSERKSTGAPGHDPAADPPTPATRSE